MGKAMLNGFKSPFPPGDGEYMEGEIVKVRGEYVRIKGRFGWCRFVGTIHIGKVTGVAVGSKIRVYTLKVERRLIREHRGIYVNEREVTPYQRRQTRNTWQASNSQQALA